MTKYTFSVDGIPVAIYPILDPRLMEPGPTFDGDKGAVNMALLSDTEADFRIEYFDKNNSPPREPHLPFAALSCFFSRVKGYPDMCLDIAVGDKITGLILNKAKEYNFLVNSGKCKNICAKTVDFLDGVSVNCNIFEAPSVCATAFCSDTECFCAERLRLLFDRLRPCGAESLAVISFGNKLRILTVGDISPYEAVRLALLQYTPESFKAPLGVTEASVNGRPYKFSLFHRGITFYPEIKYIS